MGTINSAYYPYDSELVGSIKITKKMNELPLIKINEPIDSSIFYCQNDSNPNLTYPTSATIRQEIGVGDYNKISYTANNNYGTLNTGWNSNNPKLRTLFSDKYKIRFALSHLSSATTHRIKLGYDITTLPSDLQYIKPYVANNYKQIVLLVHYYYETINADNSVSYSRKTPDEYNTMLALKVTDGTFPDLVIAAAYNPIVDVGATLYYFNTTSSTWERVSNYESVIEDYNNTKLNNYYLRSHNFGDMEECSTLRFTWDFNRTPQINNEIVMTADACKTYNTRDLYYACGNIPDFELTDWVEGRNQLILNTSTLHKQDDLRYWRLLDRMSGTTKYTHVMLCWTQECALRHIASFGLFFATARKNITYDFSDVDSLPDHIHLPEITPNGFTTGNYFTGKNIGKNGSANKEWTSTIDSTIRPDDTTATGDDVDNLDIVYGDFTLNAFIRNYAMTREQIATLAAEFNNPTNSIPTGKNPFDSIISLQQFCIDLATNTAGTAETIKIDGWDTNTQGKKIASQFANIVLGSYTIDKLYDNFLDYEPFTTAELYVPLCGRIQLPLNYIMGKEFFVYFVQDIENGACKAIIKCDQISAEIAGDLSETVSITAENQGIKKQSIMNGAIAAGSGAAIAAISGLSGNVGGAAAGAAGYLSGVSSIYTALNANYSIIKGTSTARCNFSNVATCYIKITRPAIELPTNYGHTVGYIANVTKKLSDVHGYTICNNPDVQCNLTASEKQKLKNYLQSGVYLP